MNSQSLASNRRVTLNIGKTAEATLPYRSPYPSPKREHQNPSHLAETAEIRLQAMEEPRPFLASEAPLPVAERKALVGPNGSPGLLAESGIGLSLDRA